MSNHNVLKKVSRNPHQLTHSGKERQVTSTTLSTSSASCNSNPSVPAGREVGAQARRHISAALLSQCNRKRRSLRFSELSCAARPRGQGTLGCLAGTGLEEGSRLSFAVSARRPSEEAERQLGTGGSKGKLFVLQITM